MSVQSSRFLLHVSLAALALTGAGSTGSSRAADQAFLNSFNTVKQVASTVPSNGDVNPYGIAIVGRSAGHLRQGNILVSNFNDSGNLQGTGTTIVQITPAGGVSLFAQIDPNALQGKCPGGVGLTTALAVLNRGWVIVGSLPTSNGMAATAQAGCLIVLDSSGAVVETFVGDGINGPWDMTAFDQDDRAWLFVTNVLNGNVTKGAPHVVKQGTVIRIALQVPEQGTGNPERESTTVIGSRFPEKADPNALIIGPTGVGLASEDSDMTLYVADSLDNRIAAIPNALTRQDSAGAGRDVSIGGDINDPLGLAIAPNGDIVTSNGGDGNLVETTPQGQQVAVKTVDTVTGAGSLFGIAIVPPKQPIGPATPGTGVYFVDDGDNTLRLLTK